MQDMSLADRWQQAKQAIQTRDFALACALTDQIEPEIFVQCQITQVGAMAQSLRHTASIVILSMRDNDLVTQALARIRDQFDDRFDLILVNNGNDAMQAKAAALFTDFRVITPPFALDCSTGRNIGALASTAQSVIFLDDDGLIEAGSLDAFLRARDETGAAMIRGRVFPLTQSRENLPTHYDLGPARRPNFLNAEGMSCVDRQLFLAFGGFANLMAGHEGIELSARMWRFIGTFGFAYEPDAILLHDYTKDANHASEKAQRFALMRDYALHRTPTAFDLADSVGRLAKSSLPYYLGLSAQKNAPISVITTAKNAAAFVTDYTKSLKLQRHENFEIIFVDDGSDDGTADQIAALWQGDARLKLIRADAIGRGAALNMALGQAQHDICAIADVDDISVPNRLGWTATAFAADPALEMLSFATYNEQNLFRTGGKPLNPLATDLATWLLFGGAGQFPTYAFRKSAMPEQFNQELQAGIDYDWVVRNLMAKSGLRGKVLPIAAAYYRIHDGQITAARAAFQMQTREDVQVRLFSALLGPISEQDQQDIVIIQGGRNRQRQRHNVSDGFYDRIMRGNARLGLFDPIALHYALHFARDDSFDKRVCGGATVADVIKDLRMTAQGHADAGDYREARKVLRKTRRLGADRSLNLQYLAVARQNILRQMFRFYRYD